MFPNLFQPLTINHCQIPNRLAVMAMVTNYCSDDGMATEQYINYHEEKAKGGWGLIVTEDYAVNTWGKNSHVPGLWMDEQIESHKKLTDVIHRYPSKIFAQLYNAGRQSYSRENDGAQPPAPSAIECPWKRTIPKEMTVEEIQQLVKDFGAAALRARKAGFDGIEVHAGHGYLLAEFLSPYANKRTDQYGGCFENRIRIIREIYHEIRSKVGEDYPVIIRYSAEERTAGGRDISESLLLAEVLEQMGFDALNISVGVYGVYNRGTISPLYTEHANAVNLSAEIKKAVNIPVIVSNRINDPRMAENILKMGKADIIGMGRASLADPFLPEKAKNGELTAIRYCLGCMQGCSGNISVGRPCACLVNPELGREGKADYSRVNHPRKVFIAGGGPGGLQAARIAAIRGHEVTLFEKSDYLGGMFRSAAYPPFKGEFSTYTGWLIQEIQKAGVSVRMNTPLTKQIVEEETPDTVIIATGGIPFIPPIKGIENPHVVHAEDVLLGKSETGNRIVIIGGGEVGAEVAGFVSMSFKSASIVEMLPDIMTGSHRAIRGSLLDFLESKHVKMYTSTKVCEIRDDCVIIENQQGTSSLPADTVILATGYRPNCRLAEELKELSCDVKVIGGAVKTGNAMIASREGFETGLMI